MKDLLKEAIADAKAVRQTALANAKMALEEAFTPRLQSMLSAKLAEDLSDDESMPEEDEEEEVPGMKEKPEMEEGDEDDTMPEEGYNMTEDDVMPDEDEEDSDDHGLESEPADDDQVMDDDLDLAEIIRELEGDENSTMPDPTIEEPTEEDEEVDEDINIDEIIRSLREEDETEEEEMKEEKEVPAEELEEAYNVIRFLKGKINEVNLLNAKLLYSNKLFRNFSLNEGQKMKVIENFDRAFTLREVKLVYSTLAEGFKMPSTRKVVKESFASKPIASTKPARQIISEGTELANRFKKLAGLK